MMKLRWAAGVLLGLAGILHFGVAAQAWHDAARAGEEQRRLRAERRAAQERVVSLEREEGLFASAQAALGSADSPEGRAAPQLRRAILAELRGARVRNVRLSVRPGRGRIAAVASLALAGSFDEVNRVAGALVKAGSARALSHARLSALPDGVTLDMDLQSLRGGS
jgi:hypothetical protein